MFSGTLKKLSDIMLIDNSKKYLDSNLDRQKITVSLLDAISNSQNKGYIQINSLYLVEWFNNEAANLLSQVLNQSININDSLLSIFEGAPVHGFISNFTNAFRGKSSTFEIKLENLAHEKSVFKITLFPCYSNGYSTESVLIAIEEIPLINKSLTTIQIQEELLNVICKADNLLHPLSNNLNEIEKVFDLIGKAFQFDLIFFQNYPHESTYNQTLFDCLWTSGNKINDKENIFRVLIYFYEKQLKNNQFVIYDANKCDLVIDKFCMENSLKSFLLSPVFVNNAFRGFIGYLDFVKAKKWELLNWKTLSSISVKIGLLLHNLELENKLKKANEKAVAADRIKSEFLAQLSHEIRTPINTIQSFTSLLNDELLDSKDQEIKVYKEMIQRGTTRLIRSMDMMIQMAEFQSGAYESKIEKLNLFENILKPIISNFQKPVDEKQLSLRVVGATSDFYINGDQHSVSEMITQIVDNAVKFTEAGEIVLTLREGNNNHVLEISDTGIGISEHYIPFLFTPFSQEEMGYVRKYEGNGLGLALVKHYMDINDTKIEIKSKKDKGTTFKLFFK